LLPYEIIKTLLDEAVGDFFVVAEQSGNPTIPFREAARGFTEQEPRSQS